MRKGARALKKQPFVNFVFAGVNLTSFGFEIPSPFVSLELGQAEFNSTTSWTLTVNISSDASRKANGAAFEALLYTSAQAANKYPSSRGIPVSFVFGYIDDFGNVSEYTSYQGWTLTFTGSTTGMYMVYKITGLAELDPQKSIPALRIPSLSGFVQPSAVMVGIAEATRIKDYYLLDVDRNDAPTFINHGPLTTSFNSYVRGTYSAADNFDKFPGLLRLSKSYNASREAAGLRRGYRTLNGVLKNASVTPVKNFLKPSNTDLTPQCTSFSYWVTEPTMTSPGIIHYKSNANLLNMYNSDVLEFGTSNTNVFTLSGTYNGVAYNMTDMNFTQTGFTVDGSGNSIAQEAQVVNSWSSNLADTFLSANIINDVNALASQFSGDFTVQIPGTVKQYTVAQPVSLLVMTGGTLSPVTGVYNIKSVSHLISATFITTLKLQRLQMSSANEVMTAQNILVDSSSTYGNNSYTKTKNIISPYKVNFGKLYPDFPALMGAVG